MSSDARAQALIESILASPDEETYSVYADFVMERGGPLGELVAMIRNGEDSGRVSELMGEVSGKLELKFWRWEGGFPTDVTLVVADREATLPALEELVDLPVTALTRTLRLQVRWDVAAADVATIERRLAELARPRLLQDFAIERAHDVAPARDRFVNPPAPSWVRHRYCEELVAAFPRLGRAEVAEIATQVVKVLDGLKIDTSGLELPAVRPGRVLAMEPRALLAALMYGDGTGAVRRMVAASCEVAAVDRFCVTALDVIAAAPSHWANLVRVIGGPRTTRKLVELVDRDGEAALAALDAIGSPLAILERLRLDLTGMGDYLPDDPEPKIARAGADPGEALPGDLAVRFAALDNEAIEWLISVGYTAKLRDVIELFATSSRRERAAGLVWARVIAVPAESRIRRWLGGTSLELDPCFVTADGATDHEGRPLGIDLDTPLSLAHPGELSDEQLATWLPVARPGQLDRELVLPRQPPPRLRDLAIGPFPTQTQLFRLGFRIANNQITRTDRYRGFAFIIDVDAVRCRVSTRSQTEPPPGLVHELARELVEMVRQEPR